MAVFLVPALARLGGHGTVELSGAQARGLEQGCAGSGRRLAALIAPAGGSCESAARVGAAAGVRGRSTRALQRYVSERG